MGFGQKDKLVVISLHLEIVLLYFSKIIQES